MTSPHWLCHTYSELNGTQLHHIFQLRSAVFVVEQQCVYQDIDGLDLAALHVTGWLGDDTLVAYLRILAPGVKYADAAIGRVCNAIQLRGTGIGRQLMEQGIRQVTRHYPENDIRLSAQSHLNGFYGSLGFHQVSEDYLEDGIPHMEMHRPA